MPSNDNDPAKRLLRLRALALEIVELTQDLEPPAADKPTRKSSTIDAQPTLEDYIELRRRRRFRRARG